MTFILHLQLLLCVIVQYVIDHPMHLCGCGCWCVHWTAQYCNFLVSLLALTRTKGTQTAQPVEAGAIPLTLRKLVPVVSVDLRWNNFVHNI